MTWKYGLIKIDEEDGEPISLLVELYSDEKGEFTSFCERPPHSLKELEMAVKNVKKDGINTWFYDNGVFVQKSGKCYWESKKKVCKKCKKYSTLIECYHNEAGQYHREDGPAVKYLGGTKYWYKKGELHREDGPAVIWADGTKWWYIDGKLDRKDGPAVEFADGTKWWYIDGKLDRKDGPAVDCTCAEGPKYWYLNDEEVSKDAYESILNKKEVAG